MARYNTRSREASCCLHEPPAPSSVTPWVSASLLSGEGSKEASAGEKCSRTHEVSAGGAGQGTAGRVPPGRQRASAFQKRSHGALRTVDVMASSRHLHPPPTPR